MSRRKIISAVATLSVFLCKTVEAAEVITISVQPLDQQEIWHGGCTHSLKGEIQPGDTEKFQIELNKIPIQDHDDLNFLLCLNSIGGNLEEGLKLGKLIRNNFFGTYVPENGECLSACAIAFMHGRIGYWETWVNHRMIHPTSILGFHGPRLDLSDNKGVVPMQLVLSAYDAAVSIIAQLADNASLPTNESKIAVIPLSLLASMLATPPREFLYIDLLGEAFQWDIEIYPIGLKPPIGFDLAIGYYQLCENALFETMPQGQAYNPEGEKYLREDGVDPSGYHGMTMSDVQIYQMSRGQVPDIPQGHTYLSFNTLIDFGCSYAYSKNYDGFEVFRYMEGNLLGSTFLPAIYMFAPTVKISEIWPK